MRCFLFFGKGENWSFPLVEIFGCEMYVVCTPSAKPQLFTFYIPLPLFFVSLQKRYSIAIKTKYLKELLKSKQKKNHGSLLS